MHTTSIFVLVRVSVIVYSFMCKYNYSAHQNKFLMQKNHHILFVFVLSANEIVGHTNVIQTMETPVEKIRPKVYIQGL